MAFALQNRWTRSDSGTATGLEDAVHAARLVGAEPELVLAGGSNTSVKVPEDGREVMYVKGSGADLAGVTGKDYTPLALQPVRALLATDLPDNRAMYEALAPLVLRADAPRPSIETLMHAGIAAPHVIHTHAASVLAIANTRDCARHLQAAFGAGVPVAPYRHSGLELARACVAAGRQAMAHRPGAMVLAHHGAVAWGNSAREAYEAMLDLANRAEHYLEAQGVSHRGGATQASPSGATPLSMDNLVRIARLRGQACRIAGRKLSGARRRDAFIATFTRRADLAALTRQGPSTPGHSIWTKRVPMLGDDMDAFAADYRAYLAGADAVDCAPRVVLDDSLGMFALGVTKSHAEMTAAVFVHDAAIMDRAAALGGYATIDADLMRAAELEYAGFEARVAVESPRAGEVHVIDRANERIDAIHALLAAGAAVVGFGREGNMKMIGHPAYLGMQADADPATACAAVIETFGGVDFCDAGARWQEAFQPFMGLDNA